MRRRRPKCSTEFQLHSNATTATIADVPWVGSGKRMPIALAFEACLGQRLSELCSKFVVTTTYENDFTLDATAMDGKDILAGRKEF
jgi:hypothetical protein